MLINCEHCGVFYRYCFGLVDYLFNIRCLLLAYRYTISSQDTFRRRYWVFRFLRLLSGWPQTYKVGEKNPRVFQAFPEPKLYFPEVIATKSIRITLVAKQFRSNLADIYWARSLFPEIIMILINPFNSCFTQIFDRTKTILFVIIFPEVAQNSLIIVSFHVQRNPRVFQVCGHPVLWNTLTLECVLDFRISAFTLNY